MDLEGRLTTGSSSRRAFLAGGLALSRGGGKAAPALRYRALGGTGLRVVEGGFGCENIQDAAMIRRALDLGLNVFDTARGYDGGGSERVLGAAVRGRRKDIILCTRSYAPNARVFQADLDTSLRELGTDHVDVWYIGNKDKPGEVTDAMLQVQMAAQKAGKIRFRGISTHRLFDMLPFILKQHFEVVQVPYNFAIGTARDPMGMVGTRLEESLGRLKQAGIGIVAMKVMAGGFLTRLPVHPLYWMFRRSGARVSALRWALRRDAISTTSVRMASREQLEENMLAMASPFTEGDRKILGAHLEQIRPLYCRMCGSCDGVCPKGLPVSDVVRFVTYAEGYGEFSMGQERFNRLAREQRRIRCADCSACPVACPNGVEVRKRLIRAQEMFT
jgi:uncharacterized protein